MKRMKSTMKKLLLSVLAASVILTGCGKAPETDGTDDAGVKDTSSSETEKPVETEPAGDVIIPLYKPEYEDEIKTVAPADLMYFEHFNHYFPLTKVKEDDNGNQIYQLEYGDKFDLRYDSYSLAFGYGLEDTDPETTESVSVYFAERKPFKNMTVECEYEGHKDSVNGFVPLFYNQTRGCLVGYTVDGGTRLVEYYHGYINVLNYDVKDGKPVYIDDVEAYGFTELPEANGLTIDSLVPLYKKDKENEIKTMSPDNLYDFDKLGDYFDLEGYDSDGEGFNVYKLKAGTDITLKDIVTYNPDGGDLIFNVDYYFYGRTGDISAGFYVDEDKSMTETGSLSEYYDFSKGNSFIPLFYNQTKQCLVGFLPEDTMPMFKEENVSTYKDTPYYFVEIYHGPSMPYGDIFPASPAKYGL